MKSATFFSPVDNVFKFTMTVLTKNEYVVSITDYGECEIKAFTKKGIFKKVKSLDIKVSGIDQNTTQLQLMVNDNVREFEKALSADDHEEERLLSNINVHL